MTQVFEHFPLLCSKVFHKKITLGYSFVLIFWIRIYSDIRWYGSQYECHTEAPTVEMIRSNSLKASENVADLKSHLMPQPTFQK